MIIALTRGAKWRNDDVGAQKKRLKSSQGTTVALPGGAKGSKCFKKTVVAKKYKIDKTIQNTMRKETYTCRRKIKKKKR